MTTSIAAYISSNLLTARKIDIWRESLAGIGRWEVLLENQGNTYGGTINPQDDVELKINDVSMMKGYVDDVLPEVNDSSAVYRNLMKVVGRDYGQDLANLIHTEKYANQNIKAIIMDVLSETGTEITNAVHDLYYYIYKTYEFKNQYMLDGFRDLAKLGDGDFYVDDSKALHFFPFEVATSSGVTLKAVAGASDNNILVLKEIGEKVGFDIRNYILLDAGNVKDHWTEETASLWSAWGGCAIADDDTHVISGKKSMKLSRTETGEYGMSLYPTLVKVGYDSLDFSQTKDSGSILLYHAGDFDVLDVRLRLKDGNDNIIDYYSSGDNGWEDIPSGRWRKLVFPLGPSCEIYGNPAGIDNGWFFVVGDDFDWSNVVEFGVHSFENFGTSYTMWIDGLSMPIPAQQIAEDSGEGSSQATYRKRMIPINRSDITSQNMLNALAPVELTHRKNPTQKLSLMATFQSGCKYAGQTVVVKAPSSGIGTAETGVTYRILSLHHAAEPKVDISGGRNHDAITEFDLVKHTTSPDVQPTDPLRFKLTRNPQWTYIQRLEERIRNLERG